MVNRTNHITITGKFDKQRFIAGPRTQSAMRKNNKRMRRGRIFRMPTFHIDFSESARGGICFNAILIHQSKMDRADAIISCRLRNFVWRKNQNGQQRRAQHHAKRHSDAHALDDFTAAIILKRHAHFCLLALRATRIICMNKDFDVFEQ
jgi:hypothetical protein